MYKFKYTFTYIFIKEHIFYIFINNFMSFQSQLLIKLCSSHKLMNEIKLKHTTIQKFVFL